jgi:YHS domain-containing protein
MKLIIIMAMTLFLNGVIAQQESPQPGVSAPEKQEKLQTNCPVMGGEINKDVYTDYKAKRIYFCCNSCIEKFKKDPEKYMKEFKKEGIKLEDTPKDKAKTK